MDGTHVNRLIEIIHQELLPNFQIESVDPHNPVEVRSIPDPWRLIGAGNYAAVVYHFDYPDHVVKIYAPRRPGFSEEVEVYAWVPTLPSPSVYRTHLTSNKRLQAFSASV